MVTKMADVKIPNDLEAEESTIASILIDGNAIDNVVFLKPDDFYDDRLRQIYVACLSVRERREKVDRVTVKEQLERNDKLTFCGGNEYLGEIISYVPSSMDLIYYANIVRRKAVSRKLIAAGTEIEKLGYKDNPEPSESLAKADEMLLEIRKHTVGTPIITPKMREERLTVRYTKLFQQERGVSVKTGINALDFMLGGGMFNGEMTIVAARAGLGKTTFAQNIANNVAKTENVLYCTVEMSSDNLSDRDVAGILNIPINELRLGGYSDELYDKIIVKGLREISERKVYHLDTTESPLTTTKILNGGMEIKLRFGLSLIVVDYLGILADEYGRNQYERVGYISRTIKQIARVLDVPIMALHQLSRNLEYQQDKRPQLKDLRDSGNLEEDADNVLFLYRDSYYEENPESKTTEVILAKQRQGDSGNRRKIELVFDENKKIYREVYYGG